MGMERAARLILTDKTKEQPRQEIFLAGLPVFLKRNGWRLINVESKSSELFMKFKICLYF